MKKRFIQACDLSGAIYGKRSEGGKRATGRRDVAKKDVVEVYNKFYKDQVAALYRAIHSGR